MWMATVPSPPVWSSADLGTGCAPTTWDRLTALANPAAPAVERKDLRLKGTEPEAVSPGSCDSDMIASNRHFVCNQRMLFRQTTLARCLYLALITRELIKRRPCDDQTAAGVI